jgi:hypothetical protein
MQITIDPTSYTIKTGCAHRLWASYYIIGLKRSNAQKCLMIKGLKILICTQASSSLVGATNIYSSSSSSGIFTTNI